MKYTFPVTVNLRKVSKGVDDVLHEVESHVNEMTCEKLGLIVTTTIANIVVDSPVLISEEHIAKFRSVFAEKLREDAPDIDYEVGYPSKE